MTVEKTQENLSTAVEKTEQALGGLENSLGNNEEASLLAIPENSEANDELPEGWVRATLADIAMWGSGGTPSRKNADYYGGEIPWVKTGDLGPRYVTAATELITEEAVKNSSAKYFPKGSVALAMYGATIGKTSILGIDATTNQACAVGNPIENVTSTDYLYYFLKNEKDAFIAKGKGGAQPNISQALIKAHEISLPPLAEQTVIAQTLDTLLAQVDNIKTRLDAIPKILKTFRQSVLAAAVSGKLTEAWREENECGSIFDLVKRYDLEREEMKKQKILKKSFGPSSSVTELDLNLPNSWKWVNFAHISSHDNNALKAGPFGSALKKSDCVNEGFKVYGQEQVISGDETLVTYYVGNDKFVQLKSCAVGEGDILISLVGTIGKILVLSEKCENGIINPRLVKLSLQKEIQRDYIRSYIDSVFSRDFFKGFSHGGTMEILNLSILKQLPIPLPPIEEQAQIVHRVEELFAFADQIEQQVKNAQGRVNNLTQSTLAKAFRGELTTQWRTENPDLISGDNSAETLLAKIKEERDKLVIKKKPRTTKKKVAN